MGFSAAAKVRFGALLLVFAGLARADTLPPVWTPVGTTAITSWNSINSGVGLATYNFPSNFVFPLFGQDYTSATVSSNGSIYFDTAPNSAQPQASVPLLLQGTPRIAPAWYDTNAISGSGSIFVNALSGQLVFTWEDVSSYAPSLGQSVPASNLATFQVTLDSDGTVIFAYQALNSLNPSTTGVVNSLVGSQQAIVGITDGYGAANPGSTDLSLLGESPGLALITGNTVYQMINNNPPDNSNLAGLDLLFTPQVGIGWKVTSFYNSANGSQSFTPEPATGVDFALSAIALLALRYRRVSAAKACRKDTR